MAKDLQVLVYRKQKSQTKQDVSQLIQKVVWSGRDGSPTRSLTITLVDTDDFDRVKISVEKGYYCICKHKGDEIFRGIIQKTDYNDKGTMTFKANDVGIRLTENKDVFHYKNKKANAIFKDVCKRFKISVGKCCSCKKSISEISKVTTPWDIMQEAMQDEYKKTGVRHAVYASEGKLNFVERRTNIVKWMLESDNNILSWSYSESIEKVKTRIKLYSSKNKTLATAKDKSLEKDIGIFQDVNKPDDKIKSKSKLKSLAKSMLKEEKQPEKVLSITALGLVSMRTGRGCYVVIPDMDGKKTYYITQDTHTWDGEKYTMSLKLEKTTDLDY